MKQIRIGKDFDIRWAILTNGEVIDLADRDLRLEVSLPYRKKMVIPFNIEGNIVIANISPEIQLSVGSYSLTLWENYGKDGQTAVDSCQAFALVSSTCAENDDEDDDVEVKEVIELESGNMTFVPTVVSGGGGNITIDAELSLESENAVQNKVVTQAITDTQNAAGSAMEIAVNAQAAAEDAQETADSKQDEIADLETIRQGAAKGATALQEEQYKGTYTKPSTGIPKSDLASAVQTSLGKADTALQSEQYKGTVTAVKMNGTTKNPSSGVVDLGTVITAHQDISGKLDKTEAADLYQPKGNYQAAGDYATNTALQNEITRATNEEKNIRALAEANKAAIEQLAGVEDGGSVVIVVDPALSETSENPVQNKAVTAGINEAKAAAQTAQATAEEAKTAASTAEQNAKDYTDDMLGEYAKKTDIPSVPSKVSELTNDAGYITSEDIPAAPDLSGLATKEEVEAVENKIPTVPTKVSELTNDSDYQTSAQVAAAIANKADKSEIPTVPTNVSAFTNDAGYQKASDVQTAIAGKADTSDIPTKTSELTNDSGYITADDIPNVDTSTLATKTELSQGLAGKQDTISDLATIRSGAAAGATAVQPSSLSAVATSGSYEDLSDKPTIPAEQVNADWNATSGKAQILNKPTIPTVPSNVSAFTNDAGYITEEDIPDTSEFATKTDIEPLNASFEDFGGEAEEPELPWVVYTDGVVGDINTILDNINGESA